MYQNLLSNFSWISLLSLWTIHDPCAALKTRQPVSHRLCHMWQQLTNTCDTSFISPKTLQRVNVVPYTSIHKRWSSYITPRMYCLAVLGERKENKKGHKNTFGQDNNYWKRNQTWAPHTLFCVFNNVILFFFTCVEFFDWSTCRVWIDTTGATILSEKHDTCTQFCQSWVNILRYEKLTGEEEVWKKKIKICKRRLRKIDRHRGHVSTEQEALVGEGQYGQERQLPVELACPKALHIEKNNTTRCVLLFLSLLSTVRFQKPKKTTHTFSVSVICIYFRFFL